MEGSKLFVQNPWALKFVNVCDKPDRRVGTGPSQIFTVTHSVNRVVIQPDNYGNVPENQNKNEQFLPVQLVVVAAFSICAFLLPFVAYFGGIFFWSERKN